MSPGEILLEEFLKPLELGQALRFARLLKTSPQYWMRLQADWELHQAIARSTKAS